MPASLNRHARQSRSTANKTANRLSRDPSCSQLALHMVNRRWREREAELGRDLLPDEVEAMCEALDFDDLVTFIRSTKPC